MQIMKNETLKKTTNIHRKISNTLHYNRCWYEWSTVPQWNIYDFSLRLKHVIERWSLILLQINLKRSKCHWSLNSLQGRHNGRDSVSNHQPHYCLLNRLFSRRSKKTSKLRVTGLCGGKSPGTGEFPTQMASNAENVSIWWRHHDWFTTAV